MRVVGCIKPEGAMKVKKQEGRQKPRTAARSCSLMLNGLRQSIFAATRKMVNYACLG